MEWERKGWMEEYEAGASVTEISQRHQISRKTLYKWLERYQEWGGEGLEDQSRAPHHHPNQVSEVWRERIAAVRREHPRWGSYKLYPLLQKNYAGEATPSASTIQRVLHEMGLSRARRKVRRSEGTGRLWNARCGSFI